MKILPFILSLIFAFSLARSEASPEHKGIYEMQALFLYNFANFVEWPDSAFPSAASPVRMCLFGGIPLDTFVKVFDGTRIKNRELVIVQVQTLEALSKSCQILFVGFDKKDYVSQLLKDGNHTFVLSVSGIENFAEQGGVINITRTADQMQIVVNLESALKNGLYISSDLLSIARVLQ